MFSKICGDSSSLIEILQEQRILYMKPYIHLLYLSELLE